MSESGVVPSLGGVRLVFAVFFVMSLLGAKLDCCRWILLFLRWSIGFYVLNLKFLLCLLLKLSGNTTSPTSRAQGAKQPDFKRENLSASQCSMLTSRQPSTPTSPLSCGSPSKRHYPNARAEKNSSPAVPDTKRRN